MKSNLTDRALSIITELLPITVFLVISILLLSRTPLSLKSLNDHEGVNSVEIIVFVLGISLTTAYATRRLLIPQPIATTSPTGQSDGQYRDRLARYVVTGGTIGIGGTAVCLIIALALQKAVDWQPTALSVFTTVLPVLSTWVGTVLAFYFTNESFRLAAESAQGLPKNGDGESITTAGTMIPYERVIRYEMTSVQIGTMDAQLAAENLDLNQLFTLFRPPGIIRVVIFDDKKYPIFVVRHDIMPSTVAAGAKFKDYLDSGSNRTTSRNFAWTAATATIADGRRLLELRKVTDLFVTQHGRTDEPTIGWVPDDNLRIGPQI